MSTAIEFDLGLEVLQCSSNVLRMSVYTRCLTKNVVLISFNARCYCLCPQPALYSIDSTFDTLLSSSDSDSIGDKSMKHSSPADRDPQQSREGQTAHTAVMVW